MRKKEKKITNFGLVWTESDGNSWTSGFIRIRTWFSTPSSSGTIANVTSTLWSEASKRLHIGWCKRFTTQTDATIWKTRCKLDAQLRSCSGRHQFEWYANWNSKISDYTDTNTTNRCADFIPNELFIYTLFPCPDSNVQSSVAWSAHLDPIFANNLERDAALSWQYFGATSGFVRRFPGTQWPHASSSEKKPINDFRTQDWFIQAASSPKDIVRLMLSLSLSLFYILFVLLLLNVEKLHRNSLETFSDDLIGCIRFNVRKIVWIGHNHGVCHSWYAQR